MSIFIEVHSFFTCVTVLPLPPRKRHRLCTSTPNTLHLANFLSEQVQRYAGYAIDVTSCNDPWSSQMIHSADTSRLDVGAVLTGGLDTKHDRLG